MAATAAWAWRCITVSGPVADKPEVEHADVEYRLGCNAVSEMRGHGIHPRCPGPLALLTRDGRG